jgi:hypothetical protein
METKSLKEIVKMNSSDLSSVIFYWTVYDPKYILCAYAELKRRKFEIPASKTTRISEFCLQYNQPDIETFLDVYLKDNGFKNYQEYYASEVTSEKTLKIKNEIIEPSNIIKAGKAIKNVVYTTLFMITIALIAFAILSSSRDTETIKNTYVFIGLLSLVSNFIILFQLYSAGDSLEKSAK